MTAVTPMKAHPYADAWPMLQGDDLADLAADIAENGLRDPVVLYRGMILDGRNRHAACQQVGAAVNFTDFDGDDDAALAFVQSANNARRHQSKGSLAASWALSMLAAGKRSDGRWAYGVAKGNDRNNLNRKDQAQLGVIADHAQDLLNAVRDDTLSLNAAYDQACSVRDAELARLDREKREKAEEAEAQTFVEEHAPDLAARVDGTDLLTFREARDLWNRRNREEADRIAREKAEEQRKAAEHRRAMTDLYSGMARALATCSGYGGYDDITELMAEFNPRLLPSPQEARYFDAEHLTLAARFISMLTTWQENTRV